MSSGLPSNHIRRLFLDTKKNLWIGTAEGLVRWNNGVQRVYNLDDGLGGKMVVSILEDRDGNFWVGTEYGGLSVKRGDGFVTYKTQDGLTSDEIFSLMS